MTKQHHGENRYKICESLCWYKIKLLYHLKFFPSSRKQHHFYCTWFMGYKQSRAVPHFICGSINDCIMKWIWTLNFLTNKMLDNIFFYNESTALANRVHFSSEIFYTVGIFTKKKTHNACKSQLMTFCAEIWIQCRLFLFHDTSKNWFIFLRLMYMYIYMYTIKDASVVFCHVWVYVSVCISVWPRGIDASTIIENLLVKQSLAPERRSLSPWQAPLHQASDLSVSLPLSLFSIYTNTY